MLRATRFRDVIVVLVFAAMILRGHCAPAQSTVHGEDVILMPFVEGEWWRIADDDPDVSPFRIVSDGSSNTCDFTIYPDAQGIWHAIACVRGTNAPGERVFHHWTSDSLTKENWRPQGVLDWPRGNRLGHPASVQAPHAFRHDGKYYCFYNSGSDGARAMIGNDGSHWSVFRNVAGEESIFSMGRDVNLFHDVERDRWQATYTGEWPGGEGHAMVCRTAPQLAGPWSDPPTAVKTEGNPESPFLKRRGRHYYLFQQMEVFISDHPMRFGDEPLTHMTGIWYGGKWAPEVISLDGNDYLAGYGRGLWLARLKWVEMTSSQAKAQAAPILEKVRAGRAAAEQRRRERERAKEIRDVNATNNTSEGM